MTPPEAALADRTHGPDRGAGGRAGRRDPLGRRRAWFAIAGCALSLLVPGALIFGFPGIMAAQWQETFDVGKGAVGSVLFFALAGLGALNLGAVWFPVRFTPRQRMYVGTVVFAVSLLLLLDTDDLWRLYLWAFISGASSVLVYVPAVMLPQWWVPGRRGLVSGLVSMVFALSAALLSPLLRWMLDSLGYDRMLVVLAVATLVVGVAVIRMVHYPPSRTVEARADPVGGTTTPVPGVTTILKQRAFWMLWGTWAVMGGAGIAMVTLSVGLGVSKGYSEGASIAILVAFSVTNGASRLLTGTLSDHLGRSHTMTLAFVPAGIAYLAVAHVTSLGVTALLAAVVGFGFGTLFAVSAPLVSEGFGIERFSLVFSLVMTAYGFLAGLLGPAAAGFLLDATGDDYGVVMAYLGALCLLAAVLVQFARPRART